MVSSPVLQTVDLKDSGLPPLLRCVGALLSHELPAGQPPSLAPGGASATATQCCTSLYLLNGRN